MPQQPPTTFRIEDLKARLKLEPKSRLFYPLAEELRKLDRFEDAEKVLRQGLAVHSSYVSAWISLGRVLAEQEKHSEAIEPLQKACVLDPGNVVAARLLAEAYLKAGQPVEAIKKYKLVRALMPAAEDVNDIIDRLEIEIRLGGTAGPALAPATAAGSPGADEVQPETEPFEATEPPVPLTPAFSGEGPVQAVDVDAAMSGTGFTAATSGSDVFDETRPFIAERPPFELPSEDALATKTLADLYAQQGHAEEAREIYGKILEKQPEDLQAREKLGSLSASSDRAEGGKRKEVVIRLENWLSKVARK